MKRVYIAGPYSSDNVIGALENIRRGMRMATKLLQNGMAVFCPWLDHQLFLQLREGESIKLETIQAHSMAWLRASDAVLVLKGYEASKGTLAEIKEAIEKDIPVFFGYLDLLSWAAGPWPISQECIDEEKRVAENYRKRKEAGEVLP